MHWPWKTILRPLFAIIERELLFFFKSETTLLKKEEGSPKRYIFKSRDDESRGERGTLKAFHNFYSKKEDNYI